MVARRRNSAKVSRAVFDREVVVGLGYVTCARKDKIEVPIDAVGERMGMRS